jgi:hypothetical protein
MKKTQATPGKPMTPNQKKALALKEKSKTPMPKFKK